VSFHDSSYLDVHRRRMQAACQIKWMKNPRKIAENDPEVPQERSNHVPTWGHQP